MDRKKWLAEFHESLEQKKDKLHPSDFRFYNIARLPILAGKTVEYSQSCKTCRSNIILLEELVNELPEILTEKDTRDSFETKKEKVEFHLKNAHKLRYAAYYSSLFTLFGGLAGGVLGFAISLIMKGNTSNLLLIFTTIGLLLGYFGGNIKDKEKYRSKQQL